ncbi:hypothetical protein, partial [Actinomyces sp. 186855]|uniref:hypothetical protein n=1 Tax=Actinomyces sp. 186855 TaxID=2761164 RepID=UPI0020173823
SSTSTFPFDFDVAFFTSGRKFTCLVIFVFLQFFYKRFFLDRTATNFDFFLLLRSFAGRVRHICSSFRASVTAFDSVQVWLI